ncbi:MAG TPA: AbrB/MazE/SpoVT family DNA-binding domain-containing protein [Nitrososphaerales archaeon]|nr:AbrB/MazE/SpoVT family DNA-binding domain-containing protein [Nitrososphaerales archaeon]
MEESEIATVGTKGQIVIPQTIRKELGIKPKTKLAIYSKSGRLVVTKVETPTLGEELKSLFRQVDERYKGKKKPSQRAILAEIQKYRVERRSIKRARESARSR